MAVNGFIGDDRVELINAAQEDTLRRIESLLAGGVGNADGSLNRLGAAAAGAGRTINTTGNRIETLGDTARGATASMAGAMRTFDGFQRSLARQASGFAGSLGTIAKAPTEIHRSLLNVATSIMKDGGKASLVAMGGIGVALGNLTDGIDEYSGAITGGLTGLAAGMAPAATAALVGFLGGTFLQVLEDTSKGFHTLQRSGALLGGSMLNARIAAHSAGMTMEQYSNVMQKSADQMSMFGGQTLRGAAAFADLSKQVTTGATGRSMLQMGVSFEDMGARTAEFMAHLAESGINIAKQGYSAQDAAASVVQLTKQQKMLAALNGTTLEQEREKQKAARRDSQLNASLMGANQEQRQGIQQLTAQFPQFSQFIKETVAFGGPVSKAALMQASQMGATTDALGNTISQIMAGGGQGAIDAFKQLQETSPALQKDLENQAELVKLGLVTQNDYINIANQNFQSQFETFNKAKGEVLKSIEEDMQALAGTTDKLTTTMLSLQEKQQQTLTGMADVATKLLEKSGKIQEGMLAVADVTLGAVTKINNALGGPATLDQATGQVRGGGTASVGGAPAQINPGARAIGPTQAEMASAYQSYTDPAATGGAMSMPNEMLASGTAGGGELKVKVETDDRQLGYFEQMLRKLQDMDRNLSHLKDVMP